jgi:acyl carrier protein
MTVEGEIGAQFPKIFEQVFGRPITGLNRETTASQVDGWTSLRHAQLIIAIEDHFGVEFPEEKYFDMKNVGEMVDVVTALKTHGRL